jgi:hypothetical protein
MSKRSQEKRRARAKEKKLAKRRLQGSSPLSRLADVQYCECWMTASPDDRMVSISVLRPVRGGTMAGAVFLIDRDCIGLKDAFSRLDIEVAAVRESIRQRAEDPDTLVSRIDLVKARQFVAEAIAWTRQHPFFRMPPETDRCVRILDGVGDIDRADVSGFGKDGKLFYVGRKVDLEPRLLTMTVPDFMEREDVECVFHKGNATFGDIGDDHHAEDFGGEIDDDEEEEEEREGEDFLMDAPDEDRADAPPTAEEMLALRESIQHAMVDEIRRWCFSKATMPHPELEAVVNLLLTCTSLEDLKGDPSLALMMNPQIQKLLDSLDDPSRKEGLEAAGAQLEQFIRSYPSQEAFADAMGFGEPDQP